ncbi:hypothetical protein ERO13_A09G084650v2 [Gossypium hirsutum]|nr:hypothetical protein ERO13_A09G084650v2 [Gossypium hirsutum]
MTCDRGEVVWRTTRSCATCSARIQACGAGFPDVGVSHFLFCFIGIWARFYVGLCFVLYLGFNSFWAGQKIRSNTN